jgi:outer membrane protein TolC
LDANDKLYKSEVAMAEARARLAQARIELGRASGGTP